MTVVPSVTTIMDVLAKHALMNWKIDQYLKQAFGLNTERFDSEYDFIQEVKYLTELEMDKAPSAGTDFHKEMEKYINGELTTSDSSYPLCYDVFGIIYEKTDGLDDWRSEVNFVSDLGYGGQIDLVIDSFTVDLDSGSIKDQETARRIISGEILS